MPKSQVILYKEVDGECPLLKWMRSLSEKEQNKVIAKVQRLAELGFDLRRPEADYLDDGIYELRAKSGTKNLRVLYGFAGKNIALLSHGCFKEDKVPAKEIRLAKKRLDLFKSDPVAHTYKG
jgi:phage-related protein